jgi:multidrug efflux system membrane fusion protein
MLIGAVLATSCGKSQGRAAAAAKPGGKRTLPVTVATVVKNSVPLELNTFGTVQATASVTIRSQVSEVLKEVHFVKGQKIARGDLLFTLI